jgi:hypothetical protein
MKMKIEGITSGRFVLPVDLRLRDIVPIDFTKSVQAIPECSNPNDKRANCQA